MIITTPCLALYCTFPPWLIQWIWDISTLTSHIQYGFIQTLFILIAQTNDHPMATNNLMRCLQHVTHARHFGFQSRVTPPFG